MSHLRIGTRGSKLAMWQAEWVAQQLRLHGHDVEIQIISTRGDVSKQSLSQVGGQGMFTKEIQREVLSGAADVAVHSLKDLPTEPIEGLSLAAVPRRETTADCLISRGHVPFDQLPAGATIGTGSARRGSQLLAWRTDVQIGDIRGNVDSRLRKLEERQFDAIVLAAAGLTRLEMMHVVSQWLPQDRVLPAIGQGALGLECRTDDQATRNALQRLNCDSSFAAVTAERALLAALLAGCLAPVAALGEVLASGQLRLRGKVIAVDGSQVIADDAIGDTAHANELGQQLAASLKQRGADKLIAAARGE